LWLPRAASAPAFAPPVTNPFGLPDVGGYFHSPGFADLDGDGDLDAMAFGAWPSFSENTGTANAPAFANPVTNPFGLDRGYRLTFADLDGDCDLDAFNGQSNGRVVYFENDDRAALCPAAPEPSCTAGFAKASLWVDERKPGREKLTAKLAKGPPLASRAVSFSLPVDLDAFIGRDGGLVTQHSVAVVC
jgi:hypothetical protein